MKISFIPYQDSRIESDSRSIDTNIQLPSACPCCGVHLSPSIMSQHFYNSDIRQACGVLTCVCTECLRPFIVFYDLYERADYSYQSVLRGCAPQVYHPQQFHRLINDLSPDFVRIYNQAAESEARKLLDVCGMAYRKALEFLVKDYACHIAPEDAEAIKVKPLSKCIEENIQDQRIRTVASRAAWLGNDHSHYVAKFTDMDLADLKELIESCALWITLDLQTAKAAAISARK